MPKSRTYSTRPPELFEIKGDNPFRSRAYRNAARVIERLPRSITSLLKAGEDLSELPGIGKDLASKIATIVATPHFEVLDKLKRARRSLRDRD